MRQSPHSKRPRGGRSPGRRGNAHGGNRSFESNGPNVKIRGNAAQLFERYQALARDANLSGDRVASENYLQHAEHYYRLLNAANSVPRAQGGGNGQARPSEAVGAPQPQTQPQPQPQPQVEVAPAEQPQPQPEPRPEPPPEAQPKSQPKSQAVPAKQPRPRPKPRPEPEVAAAGPDGADPDGADPESAA